MNINEYEFTVGFNLGTYDVSNINLNEVSLYLTNVMKEYFQGYGACSPVWVEMKDKK